MDTCDEDILTYYDIYYQRLFPFKDICTWFGYGDDITFSHREFTLKISNKLIIRNLDFSIPSRLESRILGDLPIGIDIGAIYKTPPLNKSLPKVFAEKELVFDIDISDYDNVRTCCKGPNICIKCWKYIVIACKILNKNLEDDFGYSHILWVFSGRRGVHCWVCDKAARKLNQCTRSGMLKFMFNKNITCFNKCYGRKLDYFDRRLLAIIEPEFVSLCIVDQHLLDTKEGVDYFLSLLPNDDAQADVQKLFSDHHSSIDRWCAFIAYYKNMVHSHVQYWQGQEEFLAYIKLLYCSPRFDVNVTTDITHLLKCPFSVHYETGKIVTPFDLTEVELFDPSTVPTLKQLINEIITLDRDLLYEEDKGDVINYEMTSLEKPIGIFKKFVEKLEKVNENYC